MSLYVKVELHNNYTIFCLSFRVVCITYLIDNTFKRISVELMNVIKSRLYNSAYFVKRIMRRESKIMMFNGVRLGPFQYTGQAHNIFKMYINEIFLFDYYILTNGEFRRKSKCS